MIDSAEIKTIALGMLLGALALAYLIILTVLKIYVNRMRRKDKTHN